MANFMCTCSVAELWPLCASPLKYKYIFIFAICILREKAQTLDLDYNKWSIL